MKFRGAFDALDESALLVDQGVDGPASRKAKVCLVQFSLQRGWLWALDAVYLYYLISLALILKSEAGDSFCFGIAVFLGRLVQPVDFHWIFNYLFFSFPLASFLPLL